MIELKTSQLKSAMVESNAMLYLVSCSLHGRVPESTRLEGVDLEVLYRLSKRHSLTAICSMALAAAGVLEASQDTALVKRWQESKEKAIRKNLMLDAEREVICRELEKQGIWYMPLKGVLLKEMYPKLGMRQMADNDILYDAYYQNELMRFMVKRGYKAESVGKGNHDVYVRKPIYNFEMHTALYGQGHDPGWVAYYSDVKSRLILDKNTHYGYHFTDEDFYVYIVSHMYKHFSGGGTGLRSLLDIYVFLEKKGADLDWQTLGAGLEALELSAFEAEMRQLSQKLFTPPPAALTEKETAQTAYCIDAGTYGTMRNRVTKKLLEGQSEGGDITAETKKKYYLSRLFPGADFYKQNAPLVYKHRCLVPFYCAFRVIRGLLRNGKSISQEIKLVRNIKQ